MKVYKVFLRLVRHGRNIGCVCVKVWAQTPFGAALEAEKKVDCVYGPDVYGHIKKVETAEFIEAALAA